MLLMRPVFGSIAANVLGGLIPPIKLFPHTLAPLPSLDFILPLIPVVKAILSLAHLSTQPVRYMDQIIWLEIKMLPPLDYTPPFPLAEPTPLLLLQPPLEIVLELELLLAPPKE